MTDREDHGLLVPRGQRPSQHLPIYGDPIVMRTQLHLHAKMPVDQCVQLHPVHACQESWEVGTRYHAGVRGVRHLPQPLNAVTEIAKDARDFRAPTQDRSDHPRHHKRSRMTFASIISSIG